MLHLETLEQLRRTRQQWAESKASVAFVPTMGNLHEGHLRLVAAARELADKVIVSIYVNPMQFGANEDLDKYPRTLAADMEKLTAAGADAVFTPDTSMIYPRGLGDQTYVEVPGISDTLCGASRPGHFRGVATIVCKLFNMVQPDHAVFGKKDYQQLMVIRLMSQDLSLPLTIHGIDTVRADDGLALSSRNGYLSTAERQQATAVYRSMQAVAHALQGERNDFQNIEQEARSILKDAGFTPDYVSIRRQADLTPPSAEDTQLVVLVAAYLGKTRLIDNLEINR
ncbi:pantoate--beta-alanine ligase [Aliidiomarina haloalkalitolerans]|uniref:Pantothenate synthetase n=1 Tax=Aliidiomarina haloalkalitolerans TaxID=859059 RepID=A0A432VTF4_9GAMM|nr:pantoate--beta-alanine ligase [Aliidiomarina haloalkalitolerans]RUO19771.1 pantoate--beta-alanine ligase [Aliidiomarina haloalkalitolerans]